MKSDRDGYQVLLYTLPFEGDENGRHTFNDHSHARNFVKYLYSKSRAHPENDDTRLNAIFEFDGAGRTIGHGYNTAPEAMLANFLKRRFPVHAAQDALFDDGGYLMFAARLPSGRSFSNFIAPGGGGKGEPRHRCRHPILTPRYMACIGMTIARVMSDAGTFCKAGVPNPYESADDRTRMVVDALVHRAFNCAMGGSAGLILSVTHLDQRDHNAFYHIHRLRQLSAA